MPSLFRDVRAFPFAGLLLGLSLTMPMEAATAAVTSAQDPELAPLAHALPFNGRLRVEGLPLFPGEVPSTLELEKFRVWKASASVLIRGPEGTRVEEPPLRSHFRGTLAGEEGSSVFIAVSGDGAWRGLVAVEDRLFVLSSDPAPTARDGAAASASLRVREVNLETDLAELVRGWSCANGRVPETASPARVGSRGHASEANIEAIPQAFGTAYMGDVAIDTDWELFNLLGSEQATADYVADLLGATSTIFQRDINTIARLSDLFLYTVGPNDDPWTGTDVVTAVFEVRDYWNANRPDVERSIVNFITGKNMGGGVAFEGSLCDTFRGYGVSAGIVGNFDPDNPTVVWDIVVVAHELGHSFGAPHTHCFNDLPLPGDPPIDTCWGSEMGCYSGPTTLPATGGSLMSYCHLQPGGVSNMRLWLGRAGFYGERSERMPVHMRAYLDSIASCLPQISGPLFEDGFETGDTSGWTRTVGDG